MKWKQVPLDLGMMQMRLLSHCQERDKGCSNLIKEQQEDAII